MISNFKSDGGCTRGRGTNEFEVALFMLSFPAFAEMKHAKSKFIGVHDTASEQHVHNEEGKSQKRRDTADTFKCMNV